MLNRKKQHGDVFLKHYTAGDVRQEEMKVACFPLRPHTLAKGLLCVRYWEQSDHNALGTERRSWNGSKLTYGTSSQLQKGSLRYRKQKSFWPLTLWKLQDYRVSQGRYPEKATNTKAEHIQLHILVSSIGNNIILLQSSHLIFKYLLSSFQK